MKQTLNKEFNMKFIELMKTIMITFGVEDHVINQIFFTRKS